MTLGPGKYDDLCTMVREKAGIDPTKPGAIVVIVLGGKKGGGFSVQADPIATLMLPDLLEHMAKQIRADLAKGI